MFIRTQENYREVLKSIVGLKPDLRIFLLTLFNTGGRDLPGAREIIYGIRTLSKTSSNIIAPPGATFLRTAPPTIVNFLAVPGFDRSVKK